MTEKTLQTELNRILYLVDSIIYDDNARNYGDRDVGIHKLKNAWESFIELHPDSDDPCLLSQKGKIEIHD